MTLERVVIVTGASRGIGAATARSLGAFGAGVTVVARGTGALERVAAQVAHAGGDPVVVAVDVTEPTAARTIVDATLERWGRIDGVVNNAATVEPMQRAHALDTAAWQATFLLNAAAPAALTGAALPALRATAGRVVNLSSTAAALAIAGLGPYCASKAALAHLTRVLAIEEPGVTAVNVQPGPVDTEMHVSLRADPNRSLEAKRHALYERLLADGELRTADVPGRAIAWLALFAPASWTGLEVQHDDARITAALSGDAPS